jgi:hypothetical protein
LHTLHCALQAEGGHQAHGTCASPLAPPAVVCALL